MIAASLLPCVRGVARRVLGAGAVDGVRDDVRDAGRRSGAISQKPKSKTRIRRDLRLVRFCGIYALSWNAALRPGRYDETVACAATVRWEQTASGRTPSAHKQERCSTFGAQCSASKAHVHSEERADPYAEVHIMDFYTSLRFGEPIAGASPPRTPTRRSLCTLTMLVVTTHELAHRCAYISPGGKRALTMPLDTRHLRVVRLRSAGGTPRRHRLRPRASS